MATAKIIQLKDSKYYCAPMGFIDADGKKIKHTICFSSPKQGAVKLAFIDENEGQPSISHLCKEMGLKDRKRMSCMSAQGHDRFENFDELEQEEIDDLERAMRKAVVTKT